MKRPTRIITIRLGFVNAYLLQQDSSAVLIDTGYRGSAGIIRRKAARHGVSREMIRLIILTHGHLDHAGSAAALREWCGAPVAVHTHDVEMVLHGINGELCPTGWQGRVIEKSGRLFSSGSRGFTPDIILTGEERLQPFGIEADVLHTPGHTAGSLCVLTNDNRLIIGDLLLKRARRVSQPFFLQNQNAWLESLRRVSQLSVGQFYAAHFGAFDRAAFGRGLQEIGLDG